MSGYRTGTVYIQGKTLSRLYLVKKMYPGKITEARGVKSVVDTVTREATIDEIADHILNRTIEKDYPKVIELETHLARVEKEVMDELQEAKEKEAQKP